MWDSGRGETGMGSETESVDLGEEKSLEVRMGFKLVGGLGFEKRVKWVKWDMWLLGR